MFNPSGSLNASFANDTEDDNSLEAPPVLEQAVDDSTHSCPEQLRLQSLLGSLAQTTTAMDPDHGRLREVAYNNACRAQQEQSASAQAAEQSLAAVPLVDVYRRGLGYVLSQKGGVARIAMKLVFLPSYSTDTNSARWRTLSTPLSVRPTHDSALVSLVRWVELSHLFSHTASATLGSALMQLRLVATLCFSSWCT